MNKDLDRLLKLETLCCKHCCGNNLKDTETVEYSLLREKISNKLDEWNDIQQRIKTYGEVFLMDNTPNIDHGIRQKHQEHQDIVNRLREELNELETIFSFAHQQDAGVRNDLIELHKKLKEILEKKK